MTALSAQQWQALAQFAPGLKPQVQLHCHHYRGQAWPVVEDGLKQQYFHVGPEAYQVLLQLDGSTTVEQLSRQWPSQRGRQDLVQLLLSLSQADLLAGGFPLLAQNLARRAGRRDWRRWLNPLAQRFPLVNPDPWLKRSQGISDRLFSAPAWWCWLGLVATALLVAAGYSQELGQHWRQRFADPANLLWLPAVYVVMKLLHEWAHGAMIRRFGGQCAEAGIMLMVFMPLPYVNAAASYGMSKPARMWVAAAGILMELGLAALALLLWAVLEPSWLRDLTFNVALVGCVASVLFNANPLMRFDGYYLLADSLEIPDLASRANRYLGYLWLRYGLRLTADCPAQLPGERPWLAGYGVAAGVYRLMLLWWIVAFLIQRWWWAGVLLGLWALLGQWLIPAARGLTTQWRRARAERQELRFSGVVGAVFLVFYCTFFVFPWPHTSYAQGVVRLPDNAVLAGTDGFVAEVLAEDGAWLEAGQPILQLTNTELRLKVSKLSARLAEQQQRHQANLVRQPAEAQAAAMAVALARDQLADVQRQLQSLLVEAPRAGRLSLSAADNLPGRWVQEGQVLAHVFDREQLSAELLLGQQQLARLDVGAVSVRVKSELNPSRSYPATLVNIAPKAGNRLPHRLLGSAGGGLLPVDAADPSGLVTLQSWFTAELRLPAALTQPVVPTRLHVRLRHANLPLAQQAWQQLRHWWLTTMM